MQLNSKKIFAKKILALDIGSRFVGVAVGNFSRIEQGYKPTPLPPFIMPESVNAFCKSVFALVSKEKADTVILGYPIPVHSHEKDKKTLDFKKKNKSLGSSIGAL